MSDLDKYRKILNHQEDKVNDELSQFLDKTSKAKLPKGKTKDQIWSQIESAINEEKKTVPIWTYISIAASLILVASLVFLFNRSETTPVKELSYTIPVADSQIIDLPDGSRVTVNANSSINFSEKWDRKVKLEGEGFFEVVEGSKFTVATSNGSVEVLGTSFNVYSRDSVFEVACKTGKVKVEIPSKSISEALTPGESIRLETDTIKRTSLDVELVGKWKSGEFYFSEQRLSNVLKEVERQFGVSVILPDSSDFVFDGYFTNKSIESALDMVCLPLGLTYEETGNKTYAIKELE
ncbi:FecR family protein [Ekhidna sp.]|uniref:FecR family protein n=1 Tax=Ekhidna sp. TaxID=2608089 RepID=UPI003B500DB3